MRTIDLDTPQALAAQEFMAYKGYSNIRPFNIEEVEGQPVWYFYYDLPEGILELEVEHDGKEWAWMVTNFREKTPTPA